MDFYSIFDEPEANEEKAETSQGNDATENSVSPVAETDPTSTSTPKSQNGVPVRWDFKAILKQEETQKQEESTHDNAEVVSGEITTATVTATATETATETTGDPEFDREWAEMMAREEAENEAKFVLENQIQHSTTNEVVSPSPKSTKTPRIKSVAEIMRGFGNPGNDDDNDSFENSTDETETKFTEPVDEITDSVGEPVLEVSNEVVEPATEPSSELALLAVEQTYAAVEFSEVNVVEDVQNELPVSATNETEEEAIASSGCLEDFASETTDEYEPMSEWDVVTAEIASGTLPDELPVSEMPAIDESAPVNSTIIADEFPGESFIGEAIEEAFAESAQEPVSETEVESYAAIEIECVAEEQNEIMSESNNTFQGDEFEPIELASEPELPEESATPVFVNVEHSWMYAEEVQQEPAEMISETSFESSLPGELPLFDAESQNESTIQSNTHTHNNLKSEEAMKFELPEYSSIIKVIGVGGGGSNAVNHMYKLGIKGVDFLVCNTDKQALDLSPVPHKIVLGTTLTEGRGAGSIPEVGRNAAIENIEDMRTVLSNNTKMVFITAGMGGGTGTGAAPVIAGVARELGILTVGIVTVPFAHEGKKRRQYAEEGIELLKQNVDTLLVIRNDKLREMYGNLKLSDAFAHADDVLTTAAKSIAEIISITQQINVDFADICTVMRNSGVAIMGSAIASGENRAVRAVEMSLNSPLLNDNNIIGARYVLLNIISGADEITMDELGEITDFIQDAAGQTAEIIKGYGVDPSLGDSVSVTIIATGFQQTNPVNYEYAPKSQPEKVVRQLEEKQVAETPKAETSAPVNAEVNPLEPFLVSKPTEPVAETKTEWTSPNTVEFEIVSTSQEITEVTNESSAVNEAVNNEITSDLEESVSEEIPEPVLIVKEEVKAEIDPVEAAKKAEQEEIQRRANERIQKLRDISLKLKSPQVLTDLENEPAYKRRNINLENVPHSSESQVSRFTLTETEDKKIEIRPNNSFLHDNVD